MKTIFSKIAVLAIFLGGCNDKFLEELPESRRTAVNFYKTAADFNQAVIGTYATLKHDGLYGNSLGALLWLGETVTDNTDFGASRQPVNVNSFEIEEFNFSLSNTYFSSAWIGHYAGIAKANAILDRIDAVDISPVSLKDQYEGEARFLRAMFYFNMVRLFGDVPLVTQEIKTANGANKLTRNAVAEVYGLIESDLQIAEVKLPDIIPATSAGRVSRWTAKGLLGKVYLTEKKFDKAELKLKEVIDANKHSLMTNYAAIFSSATKYAENTEMMFAVQYKGGNIGQGSNFYISNLPFSVTVPEFGVSGMSGLGVNRPTADMEAAYETGDLRKPASMASSYKNAAGATFNERYVVKYRQTGIITNESDVDFPVLRYADILLMYAEALNENGNTAEALKYLNKIRRRAFGYPIESLVVQPSDLIALTPAAFRLAIEKERRVEFAFEAQRWFDLVRMGRLVEVMAAKGYKTKANHVLYPVPLREFQLNPSLGQNDY